MAPKTRQARGRRRQRGQSCLYKDTRKTSLKCLQINPANWEVLAQDRPTCRRTMKTVAAIYEANPIASARAKRETHKSQLYPPRNFSAQPALTCSRCQRMSRAPLRLVGHLSLPHPPHRPDNDHAPEPLQPSSSCPFSFSSSSTSSSFASIFATAADVLTATAHNSDKQTNINPPSNIASNVDSIHTCPHCDRIFTLRIDLVSHLGVHRTETGEPVSRAPAYIRRIRLNCTRLFTDLVPNKITATTTLYQTVRPSMSAVPKILSTMPSSLRLPRLPVM
nr:unnamed protein product [Spirometra erinaceieuropaei]